MSSKFFDLIGYSCAQFGPFFCVVHRTTIVLVTSVIAKKVALLPAMIHWSINKQEELSILSTINAHSLTQYGPLLQNWEGQKYKVFKKSFKESTQAITSFSVNLGNSASIVVSFLVF